MSRADGVWEQLWHFDVVTHPQSAKRGLDYIEYMSQVL
jgi:hypothetical protein